MTKTCSKCDKEKDESEFYKNKHYKNGLRSVCKKCLRTSALNNFNLTKNINSSRKLISDKKYKLTHPEKIFYNSVRGYYKKELGFYPPCEIIECKLLTIKTKQLCKTSKD